MFANKLSHHENKSKKTLEEIERERKLEGDFVAIYHDIEEIFYGPESGMPEIARVLMCIKHKLLRDGLCEKRITYKFINQKTGLEKRNIVRAVQKLEKMGFILIKQNKEDLGNGKFQYFENSYELNPEKFGTLYNWYKNNPTVRVYEKGKAGSYSRFGVVSDSPLPLPSDLTPPLVSDPPPGKELKLSELLQKIASNNPSSNNPIKKPLEKDNLNFSNSENGNGNGDRKIIPSATNSYEAKEEIQRQLRSLQQQGIG